MSTPREPDAHVVPHWDSAALVTIDAGGATPRD